MLSPANINGMVQNMKYMRLDNQQQQDFLLQLGSMANHLEQAFAGLAPEDRIRNGDDGSFSPIEHIWHLADLEQQGFTQRMQRLQTEICPDPDDCAGARIAREGNYKQRSWTEGLEAFRHSRSANLTIPGDLDEHHWLRRGTQRTLCPALAKAAFDLP